MPSLFDSFYFAGFEGSTGWNVHGQFIDQVDATGHDREADRDYALIRRAGLSAARESIRWPLVDTGGRHDFSSLDPILRAARRRRIALLLDLFHFGYPQDTDPFADGFVDRFASYCRAATRHVVRNLPGPYAFAALNEPSYFAWAAGEVGLFAPRLIGHGPALKRRLIETAIAGIDAIWSECPDATIVSVDPLCRVVAPADRPDLADGVQRFNRVSVFESWDMLAGRLAPELGGSPRHLGVVGVNYYWTNQWELEGTLRPLPDDDPRRLPLRELLMFAWERYQAPILLTETAAPAEKRAQWLAQLGDECEAVTDAGVPLLGACLYPVTSMPEWHDRGQWTHMGLWDLVPSVREPGRLDRVPQRDALDALAAIERRRAARAGRVGRARFVHEIG